MRFFIIYGKIKVGVCRKHFLSAALLSLVFSLPQRDVRFHCPQLVRTEYLYQWQYQHDLIYR